MTTATSTKSSSDFNTHIHILLFQPRIPGNVGSCGRTAVGFGDSTLHLVRPYGFSIDDKQVRRAGLDYWKRVNLVEWNSFAEVQAWLDQSSSRIVTREGGGGEDPTTHRFVARTTRRSPRIYVFSKEGKHGTQSLYDVDFFPHHDENKNPKVKKEEGKEEEEREEKMTAQEAAEEEAKKGEEEEEVQPLILIFGSETKGISKLQESGEYEKLQEHPDFEGAVFLPQTDEIRSHNLSNMAAMAMFEARRQDVAWRRRRKKEKEEERREGDDGGIG